MTVQTLFRAVTTEAPPTETDVDWHVRLVAMPYGEVSEAVGERFEPESLRDGATGALYVQHDHLEGGISVGSWVGRNEDAGYVVYATFFDSPIGARARDLAKDGKLPYGSVGFVPDEVRQDGEVTVIVRAELLEVSLVTNPAYRGAVVLETRSIKEDLEGNETLSEDMPTEDETDGDTEPPSADDEEETEVPNDALEAAQAAIDALQVRMDAVAARVDATPPAVPQFRSAGEALLAAHRGDDGARAYFRAADATPPATEAQAAVDQQNTWLSEAMAFQRQQRPLMSWFSSANLPERGNTVDYPGAPSTSADGDGKQDSEGANLDYVEVEIVPESAPVETFGNYARATRQAIRRGDASYLNGVLEFQQLMYARDTEAAFRTGMIAASTSMATIADLTAETKANLVALAMQAAGEIEDDSLGLTAEAMLVSRDVYGALAGIFDWDFDGNGQSFTGSAGVVRQGGNIGDLPVLVIPRFGTLQMHVASSQAYRSWESSGAPFALQDEDIINLTNDFSLHGFMAHGTKDAEGLKRITVTAI